MGSLISSNIVPSVIIIAATIIIILGFVYICAGAGEEPEKNPKKEPEKEPEKELEKEPETIEIPDQMSLMQAEIKRLSEKINTIYVVAIIILIYLAIVGIVFLVKGAAIIKVIDELGRLFH